LQTPTEPPHPSTTVVLPQVTTRFRDPVRISRPENGIMGVMYFGDRSGDGFPFR
jgi:hypothetical protein